MNRVGGLSLLLEFLKRLRGNSVQLRHRRDSCSEIPGRRGIFLERRREHARPEGFGQQQNVARLHAYIAPNPLRMNQRLEEHTSELKSRLHLVCRLLLEKKKTSHWHQH